MLCRTKNIVQAAVQKRNSEALSAMTFAATLGDVDSMEHLLQRGLLINTADYDGRTTLHLAALEGNVKVLELLLQEGADPNVRDRFVLPCSSHCCSHPQATCATRNGYKYTKFCGGGLYSNISEVKFLLNLEETIIVMMQMLSWCAVYFFSAVSHVRHAYGSSKGDCLAVLVGAKLIWQLSVQVCCCCKTYVEHGKTQTQHGTCG